MSTRFVLPFADVGNGISPSSGAKLFFTITETSTDLDTFSDDALATANANPVIADSTGVFGDIFLGSSSVYKVVLKDKNNVQIWEADPVSGSAVLTELDTIALMTAISAPTNGDKFRVHGYTTLGDNQVRDYRWDSSSSATVNGGTIIAHDSVTPGRFLAEFESITAKDFGVKVDGVTDDTVNFQKAATASAGGELLLTEGSYKITDAIIFPDDTTVRATGLATIVTTVTLTNGYNAFTSGNRCTFDGIAFTGSAIDEAAYCAIAVSVKDDVKIRNCKVTGFGEAFLIQDSDGTIIEDNICEGTNRWSIMLAKCSNCNVSRNRVSGSVTSDGIKVNANIYQDTTEYDNNHILIKDNIISGCARDGIDMASGGDSITIEGNDCYSNTLSGIEVKAIDTVVTLQRVFIRGNTCLANSAHGIRLDDASKSEITDNHCDSNGDTGILAQNAIIKTKITDNQCMNNTNDGIRLNGHVTIGSCQYVDITNNTCIDNSFICL